MNSLSRAQLLVGKESIDKLKNVHVAVFGIGGVGGYAVEALARSGVGELTLFDNDAICESNINRQIIATTETVGKDKVSVMKERVLSINPEIKVNINKVFYLPSCAHEYPFDKFDYVIDAVDTVSAKLEVVLRAKKVNVPVISCMGTGGKTDITALKVSDISKTKVCPLARVMRRELNKLGVNGVKVVYSEETNIISEQDKDQAETKSSGRIAPPSMIFVPAAAGLMLAREVVFDLIKGD